MKTETILGHFLVIAATILLIFSHCSDIIWKYELFSWITGLMFALLYNMEVFIPRNRKFNLVVSYVGLAIAVSLGQLMMTGVYALVIATIVITPIILCLITAYIPVIAYQMAYRTPSKPIVPAKTLLLVSWAVLELAML